jgi:hypothetical protein
MLRLVPHGLFVTVLVLGAAACLPGPDPEGEIPPPPASCQNGVCEAALGEDCVNCKQDCSCCAAVVATGTMSGAEQAVGRSDGKGVNLTEQMVLELTLGRAIDDGPGPDLELVGQVLTGSGTPASGCVTQAQIVGTIQVKANEEGSWRLIGLWGKGGSSQFDLGCGLVKRTAAIRLEAQEGAGAQLDALRALSCSE